MINQMVADGAVSSLAMLSLSDDPVTRYNTAVALCLLTGKTGTEASIVRDGGVPAFMQLRDNSLETEIICAKGLFNLTVVDAFQAKTVGQALIPALMQVAQNKNRDVRLLAVKGLLNLSYLTRTRSRLTSLGVVALVVNLSTQPGSIEVHLLSFHSIFTNANHSFASYIFLL
jgi:hypothetical protein